jgi:hypothetical protein
MAQNLVFLGSSGSSEAMTLWNKSAEDVEPRGCTFDGARPGAGSSMLELTDSIRDPSAPSVFTH